MISKLLSCLCSVSENNPRLDTFNTSSTWLNFLLSTEILRSIFVLMNLSSIPPILLFDWKHTSYGNPKKDILQDAPIPCGKKIVLTHYFDANLIYNILLEKSITSIIHFWNKIPMDWYSKKQLIAKTATYGHEFLASCTCFEQAIDHHNYVHYLDASLHEISFVWGNNESMINSSINPDARLHKPHNILSFYFV